MFPCRKSASMTAFLALLLATAASASESPMDTYRLTESGLDNYEKTTESVYEFLKAHPDLNSALQEDDADESEDFDFAEMARTFEARAPGISEVAEDAGMPLEEYFEFAMVFALNAFSVAITDQYGGQEDPNLTDVARANLAFVRKHQQRFKEFDARMKKEYGALMDD